MSDWIDDLKRKAKAATPGPWEVDNDDCGYASPDAPMVATPWVGGRRTHIVGSPARPHGKPLPEDAEFIAAANPTTILRLIKQAQNYNAEADRHASRVVAMEVENEDLTAERDALAARLAAVEALAAETERAGDPLLRLDRLRAALSTAPTDTTKENS